MSREKNQETKVEFQQLHDSKTQETIQITQLEIIEGVNKDTRQ